MLHAARPRGPIRGSGQASRPVRKRECFETETHRGRRRYRRVGALPGGQSSYNRPTISVARNARSGPFPQCASDRNPHSPPARHPARADIDYRMLFYGADRDNRASQCVAFRPGHTWRSG